MDFNPSYIQKVHEFYPKKEIKLHGQHEVDISEDKVLGYTATNRIFFFHIDFQEIRNKFAT